MSTERQATDFYVTGGTMSPDAESYVERPADEELFLAARAGQFCYVLTAGQMGKSSLMARTARRLASVGVRSAQITLETIIGGRHATSADQFLYSIAHRIHKDLILAPKLQDWWRDRDGYSATLRFYEFLTDIVLGACLSDIVVFIDEIDLIIGLPCADEFFAAINACYDTRESRPDLKRLTFVLLGVAMPTQLIAAPARKRFRLGKGIELTDFKAGEAATLAGGFGEETPRVQRALLRRVLYWTSGHPYLTQTLCRAIASRQAGGGTLRDSIANLSNVVDHEVEAQFLKAEAIKEEHNLASVGDRLTRSGENPRVVLSAYLDVVSGNAVADEPLHSTHRCLKLAGVVKVDRRRCLRVRNRIYERVFGRDWIQRELANIGSPPHLDEPTPTVRIFLSSPGDVAIERSRVRDLLLGLARGPFVRGRVSIDIVSWDDPHAPARLDARFTPQQALNRNLRMPGECDLTVMLLWGRMGTPLTETKPDGTPYLSGTEWEFENALAADKPVLVYRRSEKVLLDPEDPDFDERLLQKRRVDGFFASFVGEGGTILRGFTPYLTTEDLLPRLRLDVEHFLSELLGDKVVATDSARVPIKRSRTGLGPATRRRVARPRNRKGPR